MDADLDVCGTTIAITLSVAPIDTITVGKQNRGIEMKSVRLIKQKDLLEQKAEVQLAEAEKAAEKLNPMEVVRGWVNERKETQKQKSRQMFSSLFA
jgi:hypothetical protein